MRKWLVLILSLILLLIPVQAGYASRVLSVPSADLLEHGSTELDYTYLRQHGYLELNVGLHPRVNLGLRQNFGGPLTATAKVGILAEKEDVPSLALGGEFGLNQHDVFFVASKQLGTPVLRTHFAWGTGRFGRGMAGLSLVLNPVQVRTGKSLVMPTTSVVLEYDGVGLNTGLVAHFSPELRGFVATTFDQGLGIGFNYTVSF